MKDYKGIKYFTNLYKTSRGGLTENGYAQIPDHFPIDYFDEIYSSIEVWGGLTFGGYATLNDNGEFSRLYLSKPKDTENYIKVVGFDDDHIERNPETAIVTAEKLAKQIYELGVKKTVDD